MVWDADSDVAAVRDAPQVEGVGKGVVRDVWAAQRPGRVVSVFARRVGIVSRTSPDNRAPKSSARSVARG